MKVYAPRRVVRLYDNITSDGANYSAVLPLDGEWVDVPDLFYQVTSGRKENTCVHAKLVAEGGLSYTTLSTTLSDGRRSYNSVYGRPFGSSDFTGGGYDITYSKFTSQKVIKYRFPEYKGKKPVQPRKYHETVRLLHACHVCSWPWQGSTGSGPCIWIAVRTAVRVNPWHRRTEFGIMEISATRDTWNGVQYRCPRCVLDLLQSITRVIQDRWPDQRRGYDDNSRRQMALMAAQAVEPLVVDLVQRLQGVTSGGSRFLWIEPEDCTSELPTVPDQLEDQFLFGEIPRIVEGLDPRVLGKSMSNYWRNWLTEHAIYEACDSFPKLSDNSIQNIMELVGFIKALVVDHRIEIPKSLSSAWLAYRYQYSTTKMDVEEAVKFVHRHMDIGDLARGITCYGVSSCIYEGTEVTCRCSIDVKPRNVGYLANIWRALDTYGLTPDFYVLWDSLPYSFMVDWFLPIGDVVSVWDANAKYFSGEFYDLSEPVYSFSYTRELPVAGSVSPSAVKCYSRWVGSVPSSLNSWYWFDAPSASSRTVWYRVLDAASLFIGH